MQIGELSKRSGVSRHTLRYYEKRGLIRSVRRPNGYREYQEGIILLLDYIRTAQSLGFTLTEVEDELPMLLTEGISQHKVAELLRGKLAAIDARILGLAQLRERLDAQLTQVCPIASQG